MEELSSPEDRFEIERLKSLKKLVAERLDKNDAAFVDELGDDEGAILGYIYGRLVEKGLDPDETLQEYGITEGDSV